MIFKLSNILGCLLISTQLTFGADLSDLTFDTSGATAIVTSCSNSASGALEIPETYQGKAVTGIRAQAFHSCANLTSVVIPSSITSIGDNAFYNCRKKRSSVESWSTYTNKW